MKQNGMLTQPRSLVTEPKNPATVKIADVDVRVAVAVNLEKMKLSQQKHLKMFLNFDVLLEKKMADANAERVLTRQSRTDKLILPALLEKLFSETLTKRLKAFL